MHLSILVGLLVAASTSLLSTSAATQQPIQVYLHPSPPHSSSHKAPTLKADQAKAVLAHHFSAGEGVDEFEKLPGGHDGWVHLLTSGVLGSEEERKPQDKARVVIINGDVDVASILPSQMSSPSFYLPSSTEVHTFLQPYLNRASSVVSHILDSLPPAPKFINDIFDVSTSKASHLLSQQLQALSAIASRLDWKDRSRPASNRWEATMVSALGKVDESDEVECEVQKQGREVIKAALEVMTTDSTQPPLVLIIMPSTSRSFTRRSDTADVLKKHRVYDPTCYPSNRTCTRASGSCSGVGACQLVSNNTDSEGGNSTCWACQCQSGYLGVTCQKADYTFQTTLLIFTPILLLVVLMASVGLLNAVGGESLPSTLSLSVGAPNKRD